eukprot:GHVU01179075.1.p1 GENE.GHVU01179075.1~~GHVU01179075.1.p1  ORF type:complete len:473 (-),score=66.12 GHVU01179075.1:244-1602(-)
MPNVLIGSNLLKLLEICPVEILRQQCGIGDASDQGLITLANSEVTENLGSFLAPQFSLAQAISYADSPAEPTEECLLRHDDEGSEDYSGSDEGNEGVPVPSREDESAVIRTTMIKRIDENIEACKDFSDSEGYAVKQLNLEFSDVFRNKLLEGDEAADVEPMEVMLLPGKFPEKQRVRKVGPAMQHVIRTHYGWGEFSGYYRKNNTAKTALCPLVIAKSAAANFPEELVQSQLQQRYDDKHLEFSESEDESVESAESEGSKVPIGVHVWRFEADTQAATRLTPPVRKSSHEEFMVITRSSSEEESQYKSEYIGSIMEETEEKTVLEETVDERGTPVDLAVSAEETEVEVAANSGQAVEVSETDAVPKPSSPTTSSGTIADTDSDSSLIEWTGGRCIDRYEEVPRNLTHPKEKADDVEKQEYYEAVVFCYIVARRVNFLLGGRTRGNCGFRCR